ncbi:MAG: phosphopantetheine-binding protein [Saccharofermentans sp.]|nr:phosphopantetheine-binding protein [Saccharofermentans sp.]
MADLDHRKAEVTDDVIRMLAETLEISPEEITPDLEVNVDLQLDSLQLYEFVIAIEEFYNVRLPDELLDQVKTVDDMIDVIIKLTSK